jgi:hypothetical protein
MLLGGSCSAVGLDCLCTVVTMFTYIHIYYIPWIRQMTIGCGISHRITTHVYKYNSKQFLKISHRRLK